MENEETYWSFNTGRNRFLISASYVSISDLIFSPVNSFEFHQIELFICFTIYNKQNRIVVPSSKFITHMSLSKKMFSDFQYPLIRITCETAYNRFVVCRCFSIEFCVELQFKNTVDIVNIRLAAHQGLKKKEENYFQEKEACEWRKETFHFLPSIL